MLARKTLSSVHFRLFVTGFCASVGSRVSLSAANHNQLPTTTTTTKPHSIVTSPFSTMSADNKQFDPNDLKKRLSEMEYAVTQEKATEPPFTGKYLKNTKPGTYTCVVCGSKLFSSTEKFESGCGWPAFSDILTSAAVKLTPDHSLGMTRTEATCANCGAHLGHVFDDGPAPKRTRYCINSAAMSFTPAGDGSRDEL